jgi:hypothetical protein
MNVLSLNKSNKVNLKFYLFLAIMLLALFFRNAFSVNIPVYVFLILSAFPIVFGGQNHILAFAACCIPMSTGFQYKYVLFMCVIVHLLKCKGKLKISVAVVPVLLMMVWELFHAFYGQFSINEYFRSFAELIILALALCMDMEDIDYKLVLRSLAISTVGVCLIMLYLQLQSNGFSFQNVISRGYHNFRFGTTNTTAENFGLNFNSNGLGFICNLSLTGMLVLFVRREYTTFDMVLLIVSALFGLMTLSRTFVVCLAFIVICFLLSFSGTRKKKALNILIIAAIVGATILILKHYMPQVYNNLILRFNETDILNGRDTLITFYNKHIFSSLPYFLFGIGLQDFQGKLSAIYGGTVQVCHNGLQEVWVAWGIVGVVFFVWAIFAMIRQSKLYSRKKMSYQYIPLGFMLLSTSAGQLIRSELALLSLTLIYVCLCMKPKEFERQGCNE